MAVLSIQQGWSQGATTSAMNGVITDKEGAGLPGATVIAVHTPTNTQYVAPTNSEGRFNIQNMRVGGPYTVRITFVGYQDVTRENIFLTLGQNQRLDINLSESTQQLSEVTVSGRRDPVINSGRTGAATSVQREQIERLPSLSRSFQDFTRLTPQASGTGTSFGGRNGNFNNVTIDGAIFNNSFGLSGTVGGQANAQPISLDAIQEIQVSIAPFDVRQGSFTGAGINAITRSGTNEVSASVYGFRRSNNLVGDKVRDINQPFPEFTLNQLGARVGGPIIKNKLFYFVSVEGERRDDPPGTFVANRPGLPAPGPGSNTSAASASELDVLSNFLQTTYGYNPGPYEGYQLKQNSDKITAKIDWNINATNTFSIKYNYLKSYRDVPPSSSGSPTVTGGRSLSTNTLPFLASYYRINNNLNSFIAELNSTLAGGISNQLQAGFTAQRDFRSSLGGSPFPFVDILYNANGPGAVNNEFTSFGYELFTPINILNSDIYQLSDNISKTVGKHTFTLGTYNEYYKFANGFAPDLYGRYRFNSLSDFYSSAGYTYNATTLALTPRDGGALASATNNYTVVRDQISSTPASAAKGNIAVTDKDFRNPQLMRTNLAVDYRLPGGIVATLEGIYSKTLNDVLPQDINLVNPTGVVQGDGRVTYPTGTTNGNSNRYRNGRDFNNVIYLTNTSKGYQYSITGELKKQVNTNLFASAAYTYGQSRDLYSGTSSTAVSIWEFNPHAGNPNNLPLSYSSYDLRHRVIASFSYRKEYADHFATTISAFYNGQSGSPFSYSYYGGDINNDGGSFTSNSNDLIYIPRSQNEIVLVTDGPNDRRTVDQIWGELNTFIENDDYLKEHRGEYAARNGARTPWQHRIDVRLLQDIYTKIGEKSHTIQLSVDVINFGNLLNKDWGRDYSVANGNYGLLRYQGLENDTTGAIYPTQQAIVASLVGNPNERYTASEYTSTTA